MLAKHLAISLHSFRLVSDFISIIVISSRLVTVVTIAELIFEIFYETHVEIEYIG